MVLLIIIPIKWLGIIGNINPTFSGPNPNIIIYPDESSMMSKIWVNYNICSWIKFILYHLEYYILYYN